MRTMACEQARAEIPLLVDGELDPAGRESLEQHLAGCPDCRSRREFLVGMKGIVRTAVEGEGLGAGARQRILERLRSESAVWVPPGRRGLRPGVMRTFAAVAIVLLALAGAWMLRQDPRTTARSVASLPAAWSGTALAGHHEECWTVPVDPAMAGPVADWIRSHPGAEAALPALTAGATRYDLRVCPSESGERALHVLWLVPREQGGEPYRVSVFAMPGPGGPDAPARALEPARRGTNEMVARRGGWTVVLVSEAPLDLLARLAPAS